MISRTTIISGSAGAIFAIFSPNESVFGADDRSGPLSPIAQGTLPWQPNNIGWNKKVMKAARRKCSQPLTVASLSRWLSIAIGVNREATRRACPSESGWVLSPCCPLLSYFWVYTVKQYPYIHDTDILWRVFRRNNEVHFPVDLWIQTYTEVGTGFIELWHFHKISVNIRIFLQRTVHAPAALYAPHSPVMSAGDVIHKTGRTQLNIFTARC